MKLGTKARYGVMAMVDIANHIQNQEDFISLVSIGERQGLPIPYLEQLFNKLKKANLVKGVRGSKGGYTLSRPASNISVYDVILALEGATKMTRCENNSPQGCQIQGARCLTHDLWHNLGEVVIQYLRSVSLENVVKKQYSLINLLPASRPPKSFSPKIYGPGL